MKKLALIATLASAALMPMSGNAATVNAPFSVSVAFTPVCTVNAGASVIAFTYTAFAVATTVPVAVPITLNCTRGVGTTATAAFDGGVAAGLIGATNLVYTLSAPVRTAVAGAPATAVPVFVGGPDVVTFNFGGTLAVQAGGGVLANPAPIANVTVVRQLVVTY